MNKVFVFVALAFVAVAMAGSMEEDQFMFEKFQQVHKKEYAPHEVDMRFGIFRANLRFIEEHNEKFQNGETTFTLGVNKFADLTNDEYRLHVLGYRRQDFRTNMSGNVHVNSDMTNPVAVDWRTKGVVTGVKNQGQCGSCWSFSATGSMEGAHALATGNLVSLSEQQLVDCVNGGANTCARGGEMDQAFAYAIKNGMETEQEYPYHANSGNTCAYNPSEAKVHISGFTDVQSGSEPDLEDAVANYPTVSVAIDASSMWFQLYSGGVYDDSTCRNGPNDLDHGVLAVGYGVLKGKDYWIVKNSWGPEWGLSGYILMSRNNNNQCGIATDASYPTV